MRYETVFISIHTSAREVTSAVLLSGRHIHISIHTSAREVTALHPILSRQYGNFNPHFRKGSDLILFGLCLASTISIHTSAREVTKEVLAAKTYLGNFNPHFRKGSDNGHL